MDTSKKTSIGNQKAISDNSDVREEVAPESLHAPDKSYTKMFQIVVADIEEPPPKAPVPTKRITRARANAKNDASEAEDSPSKVARKRDKMKKQKVGGVPKKGRK